MHLCLNTTGERKALSVHLLPSGMAVIPVCACITIMSVIPCLCIVSCHKLWGANAYGKSTIPYVHGMLRTE